MSIVALQLFLLIPRMIESLLFFIIIFKVNQEFKRAPFWSRPLLHKLFVIGLSGWWVYIFLDIFIYSLADLSIDPSIPIRIVGYNCTYPSLFWGNILRDIAFAGILVESWAYYFIPYTIIKGEKKTLEMITHPFRLIMIIITSLFLIWNEKLVVVVMENQRIITEDYSGIGFLSLFSASIIYLIAAIHMFRILHQTTKTETNFRYTKKIRYFSWGILSMGFAYLWVIFWNVMALYFPILESRFLYLFISFVIHGAWMLSPILIYYGLSIKMEKSQNDRH